MRSSNNNWTEEVGVIVHRSGMMVMLLGFGGLFYYRKISIGRSGPSKFSWSDDHDKLVLKSLARGYVLNISKTSEESESTIDVELLDLQDVRCLIARGKKISMSFVAKIVKHQELQILDLQNATLDQGVMQELEKLENLEVLLLHGCMELWEGGVVPLRGKVLRMALPEVRMIVENRIISLQQPIAKKPKL